MAARSPSRRARLGAAPGAPDASGRTIHQRRLARRHLGPAGRVGSVPPNRCARPGLQVDQPISWRAAALCDRTAQVSAADDRCQACGSGLGPADAGPPLSRISRRSGGGRPGASGVAGGVGGRVHRSAAVAGLRLPEPLIIRTVASVHRPRHSMAGAPGGHGSCWNLRPAARPHSPQDGASAPPSPLPCPGNACGGAALC